MRRAGGVLLALLFGLGLSEVAVRLIGGERFGPARLLPFDVSEPVVSGMRVPPEAGYLVFDPELGWVVGPNRKGRGGLYHSDNQGQRRDDQRERGPWAVAYGDSFTHGDDVGDHETWLARIGAAGLRVANRGVPGYGVDQAWLRYRRDKTELDAQVIVIGVMADNIARHLNRYRPFITPAERIFFVKPRFERVQGKLQLIPSPFRERSDYARPVEELRARLLQIGDRDHFFEPRFYRSSWSDRSRLSRIVRTLTLNPEKHADWRGLYGDQEAVDLTVDLVRGFVDEVRGDGRQPVIAFLPEKTIAEDVVHGRTPPSSGFLARLRGLGCPLVDFTVPVSRFAAASPSPFLPHYSAALSQEVADYFMEWKRTEKSLP